MTIPPDPSTHLLRQAVNRRRFLSMLAGAGALGAVGCASGSAASVGSGASSPTATIAPTAPSNSSAAVAAAEPAPRRSDVNPDRRLVVIELQGGNDGLAMLQPYDDGVLQDRRSELMSESSELIDAGSGFGWHPALAALADVGIAAVVGVGSDQPDFSHFEMEQRWWRGDSGDGGRLSTGFFGRVCDQLDVGDPVTGLSLSGGPTPALLADKAVTAGIGDPGTNWFMSQDDAWFSALRGAYGDMSVSSAQDHAALTAARGGLANTVRFAEALSAIDNNGESEYPWTGLGQQMRFAADTLALDVGVRVVHLQLSGFDTHAGQQWRHEDLMTELNDATVFFVQDLKERGLWDDTLIVTTSEFGRRVDMNDRGTDHGGASTMMVCGGGAAGVHGDAPSLKALDDGNLVATARFEDYYATVAAEWFGIEPSDVLPAGGDPISGLL